MLLKGITRTSTCPSERNLSEPRFLSGSGLTFPHPADTALKAPSGKTQKIVPSRGKAAGLT